MTILSDYITQTRRLLHDVSGNFWTDAELTDYINEGRSRTVSDTGCLRTLQAPIFQPNVESYVFGGLTGANLVLAGSGFSAGTYALSIAGDSGSGAAGTYTVSSAGIVTAVTITAQGSGYVSAPVLTFPNGGGSGASAVAGFIHARTLDVLSVTILWGTFRVPLSYMPFTELTSKLRAWTSWQQRPAAFSVFGQQNLYIGPLPDQTYTSEMDSIVLPANLVDNTTIEQIVYPYTAPITYYAARLAKLKEQSYSEAEMFMQMYKHRALDCLASTFTRRLP